ncbi:MAG TPA: response regulator [Calditrichia bacterium]|nr:response regulator [Calditrichia bacterium]HQV31762.1 response regulator [Calditrichia bacterium]
MTPPAESPSSPELQLLCVDDDPVIRKSYLDMLKGQATVTLAENGAVAVRTLSEFTPDAIFMDLVMPQMDGFTALKTFRANPALEAIPIVMTSAKTDLQTILSVQKLGADGFIAKPFLKSELLARIPFVKMDGGGRARFPEEMLTRVDFSDPAGGEAFQEERRQFLGDSEFLIFDLLRGIDLQQERRVMQLLARLLTALQYFQMHGIKENVYLLLTAVTRHQWAVALEKLELILGQCRQLSRFKGPKKTG